MANLEFDDLQGFVARGYGHLHHAAYVLLHFEDVSGAKAWLDGFADRVTPASTKPQDLAVHVAFTREGLDRLGMHTADVQTFSHPFYEGMAAERRTRVLGDLGESAPEHWRWGGPENETVHALVLLFACDAETLTQAHADVEDEYDGVRELERLTTYWFDPAREHFGFRDGIAQPILEGLTKEGPPENTVPDGEFILGYKNDYDKLPVSPTVAPERDPDALLPRVPSPTGTGEAGDFGRNGTYLVFRQMSQDVKGFWQFLTDVVSQGDGALSEDALDAARERIAAKMVGRWKNGAPLAKCPTRASAEDHPADDAFGYRTDDMHGSRCPIGAHLRRANPRDGLEGGVDASNTVARRHRLLRRGRPYGEPIAPSMDVNDILTHEGEHEETGLHFICLNADLGRQFEFVQHTWINNQKFERLYTDADPLIGNQFGGKGTFTVQREPVRERVTEMKRFVEVRGGAYFFLPGLRALRYLASL